MPRRRAWTEEEVDSLLSLVEGSGAAALLVGSTSRPNEALWREISQGLAAAGYSRSVAQCRTKWQALKRAFHLERATCRRGKRRSSQPPPHYQAMKRIWKAAGQPLFGERRMPDVANLPTRKRGSALAAHASSSPEATGHDVGVNTSGMLSPLLQRAKNEPESSASGDDIAGVRPAPSAVPRSRIALKQERAGQEAGFPGKKSPRMRRGNQVPPVVFTALGSPGTAAMSEQPAVGEEAPGTSRHGSGVAGLLQSVQQLLVQIRQTSRQQQALLESLASDTVSHLYFLSHSLVQVGETLHQLLLQPETHPGPLGQRIPNVPLYEGGPGVRCCPGIPLTSRGNKEVPQMSPPTNRTPP